MNYDAKIDTEIGVMGNGNLGAMSVTNVDDIGDEQEARPRWRVCRAPRCRYAGHAAPVRFRDLGR